MAAASAASAASAETPYELRVARDKGYAVSAEEETDYLRNYRAGSLNVELPEAVAAALNEPFPVTQAMVEQYQRDGFIQIKGVLPRELLALLGEAVREHTMARNPMKGQPLDERVTYNKAFIQVGGIWRHGGLAQLFSFSRRLAGIAADLMQTTGTLLHHDQALFKEPGGGHTPWHCDQQYWPLDADSERPATSCWVPLVDVPLEMGPLEFAKGSHLGERNEHHHMPISDDSEANIWKYVEEHGFEVVTQPFELGDVSFHSGWMLHRADGNATDRYRDAHTMQ
jgi:hypothetical protein